MKERSKRRADEALHTSDPDLLEAARLDRAVDEGTETALAKAFACRWKECTQPAANSKSGLCAGHWARLLWARTIVTALGLLVLACAVPVALRGVERKELPYPLLFLVPVAATHLWLSLDLKRRPWRYTRRIRPPSEPPDDPS
ncbi:MAG: hypothetical protein D6731_04385 [Planctomycetota bacterium]|nr:MAG: hypothetical protein D6731_04385 [Planctomycetota bacterium]